MGQQPNQVPLMWTVVICLTISIPGYVALPGDVPDTFYEFGTDEGDLVAPVNDDGSTEEIGISTQFPFFDHLHGSLYVNTNGLISFLGPVGQYTPNAFPLGDGRRFVAPFWADVDTRRNNGRVYYRETTDDETLARATLDVRETFVDQSRFSATWVFVCTWHRVTYFGGSASSSLNSFQAVLVTNGRHSFTIINYGDITWTLGDASGGIPAQAGFNAGDGIRYFNIPGSRQPEIVDVETTSNVGRAGRWVFRIDSADIHDGGCNTAGSLTVSPRFGSPLGGQRVIVAGPCLELNDTITCLFDDVETAGQVINNIRASCVTPLLLSRGRIPLAIAVNGGNYSHNGIYIVAQESPMVETITRATWRPEESPLTIQWNPLALDVERVDVDLVAFQIVNGETVNQVIPLVTNEDNDGQINMTSRLETGTDFWAEVGAIRVRESGSANGLAVECLWSRAHVLEWYTPVYIYELALERLPSSGGGQAKRDTWSRASRATDDLSDSIWDRANDIWDNIGDFFSDVITDIGDVIGDAVTRFYNGRCEAWYEDQLEDPPTFDVEPCPCTTDQLQAEANFVPDPACNMGSGCGLHPGAFHCARSRNPSASGAGQQCCYSKPTPGGEPGTILPYRLPNGQLAGGTFDRAHSSRNWAINHFFADVKPFFYCCIFADSSSCDKYGELRPSDDCSDYDPPRPAAAMGDPHIITLDGKQYTFNGIGEYTVLDVAGTFSLQGRTQQAVNEVGDLISASMWTAFAMQSLDPQSDTVQVETNERQPLQVMVNGLIETFDDLPQQEFNGADVAMDDNFTSIQISFANGISVKVSSVEDSLQFQVALPHMYETKTTGLLGTWNNDEDDDFQAPDGTIWDKNSSMADIHDFGQLWQTDSNSSLFTYPAGSSHGDFQRPDFQPVVDLEDFSDDAWAGASALCGNDSFQCLFDYLITGRESFALASKKAMTEYDVAIKNTQHVVSCGFQDTPTNGNQEAVNYLAGSNVTFSCGDGYRLEGSESRTCQDDGFWSGQDTTCVGGDEDSDSLPYWTLVTIGAGAAMLVVFVALIAGVIWSCKRKQKKPDPTV